MAPISRLASVAVIAVAATTLSACGSGSGASGSADELRIASHVDISTMDPLRSGVGPEVPILLTMYDTVLSWNTETGAAEPGIAESWTQTTTDLTLKIREGVTFQDGTAVDAEAVKFNIERGKSEWSTQADNLASVESVEVVDAATVKINLNTPDPSLLAVLADRGGMLVSPTAAKANENDFSQKPVGAGAYTMSAWKRGSQIDLSAYADYWNTEVSTAPELDFKIIPDGQTASNALISGQVDMISEVAVANVSVLEGKSDLVVKSESTNYVDQVYLNSSRPGLKDVRVREALNLAVDRGQVVKAAYFGLGEPASGVFPATSPNYAGEEATYAYDLDKAKALMAEAGFGSGLKIELVASPNRTRVAEILKENWAQIGVDVSITTRDVVSAGNGYFIDKQGDALVSYWGGRVDSIQSYEQLFDKNAFYNAGKRTIAPVDEALAAARTAGTDEERQGHIVEAGKAVFADSPNVPLSFTKVSVAMTDDVKGFEISLVGPNRFVGTTISK